MVDLINYVVQLAVFKKDMNEQPHNYNYRARNICAVTHFKYHNGIRLDILPTNLLHGSESLTN
jgi:hypothetical protein